MKKSLLVTSITLALTLCISTSSFASTNNSEELKPFNYNNVIETYFSSVPDYVKDINLNVEVTNDKNYLTDEEVSKVTIESLIEINEKIKSEHILNKHTENEANKIVAELIKDSISKNKNNVSDYEIPGWDSLNDAEKDLATSHPIEFTKYATTANAASNLAQAYYGESQLYQGNGDAFRHSYWNAMLVQELGNDPLHGTQRAQVWTDAHEATSSGIDKRMDLINNESGRYHAYLNFDDTRQQLSDAIKTQVSQGGKVRIVNNQLVATNGVTGK
ncbi:DUF6973 domain-containing protein [Virgibacillus natechei]|uniref:DUF6973 domain-containing protein n=1 Tax=Virgibacillus sp. CBA3643 TaxID=2942278 RepID=UPI0035A3C2EF